MNAKKRAASPLFAGYSQKSKHVEVIDLTDTPEAGPAGLHRNPEYIDLDDLPDKHVTEVLDLSDLTAETREQAIEDFTEFIALIAPFRFPEQARSWHQRDLSVRFASWLASMDDSELRNTTGGLSDEGFDNYDFHPIYIFFERLYEPAFVAVEESDEEFLIRKLLAEFCFYYRRVFRIWINSEVPAKLMERFREWPSKAIVAFSRQSRYLKLFEMGALLETYFLGPHDDTSPNQQARAIEAYEHIMAEIDDLRSDPSNLSWQIYLEKVMVAIDDLQDMNCYDIQEALKLTFTSFSPDNTQIFEELDILSQLRYLLINIDHEGTEEELLTALDPSCDCSPMVGLKHRAIALERLAEAIFQRCTRYKDSLPSSHFLKPHELDKDDLDSPTGKFSFKKFVASLRVDLIISYMKYFSFQEFLRLKDSEFEQQILLLYNISKAYNKDNLVNLTSDKFDEYLVQQLKYAQNMAARAAYGIGDIEAEERIIMAQDHLADYSGRLLPYMKSLSYLQANNFAQLPPEAQEQALSLWMNQKRMQNKVFKYEKHEDREALLEVKTIQPSPNRHTASRETTSRDPEFLRFLGELQAEENNHLDADTNTAQDIQDAANELGAVPANGDKYSLPGMLCELHPHQVIGVAWMAKRESHKDSAGKRSKVRGGVLADAMGLGKTVQALGVMVKNRPTRILPSATERTGADSRQKTKPKITLIVCPVALIHQWAREIETKAPGFFDVRVHHGPTKMRSVAELRKYDVVITSYGTLAREYPVKKSRGNLSQEEKDLEEDRIEREKGILFRVKFLRLILDEAHTIKNPAANVSVACCNLESSRQWCLTGTPFQNKVDDLYPLLRVLQVPYFSDRKTFRAKISKAANGPKKLWGVLAPFSKRRTKEDTIAGKPIIQLPDKTVDMTDLKFDEDESALYQRVQAQMVKKINKYLVEGTAVKKINHIFTMLLRLRQLCIHPYLILDHLAAKHGLGMESFTRATSGIHPFTDLAMRALAADEDSIVCALCQVEASRPVISENCKHCFCRECALNEIEDEYAECPICSKIVGRLVEYDAGKHTAASLVDIRPEEKKVATDVLGNLSSHSEPDIVHESELFPIERDLLRAKQEDVSSPASLRKPTTRTLKVEESDDEELPELCIRKLLGVQNSVKTEKREQTAEEIHQTPGISINKDQKDTDSKDSVKLEGMVTPVRNTCSQMSRKSTVAMSSPLTGPRPEPGATPTRGRKTRSSKRYTVDPADEPDYSAPSQTAEERRAELQSWQELLKLEFIPSTKLTAVENKLKEWMMMDGSKLIVFSQFVKALDLLARICELNGWEVLRYQGDMNMRERDATIKQFEEPDGPRILLMSLKAGGVGLNLVCANKVILLDFWWNAAAEHQAIDRCHRMGQTKEVFVSRLYLPGTVEERILYLQESKLKTAGVVLGESEGGGKMARLNLQDLMGLFGEVKTNANGVEQIVTRH